MCDQQIAEDSGESGKAEFANFRCAVWHRAVAVILESIKQLLKVGYWISCGDNKLRLVYPQIMIVSADYEEVYVLCFCNGMRFYFL